MRRGFRSLQTTLVCRRGGLSHNVKWVLPLKHRRLFCSSECNQTKMDRVVKKEDCHNQCEQRKQARSMEDAPSKSVPWYVIGKNENSKSIPWRQWKSIRAVFPDCVIFFKLGKFYELIKDDAFFGRDCLGLHLNSLERSGFPDYTVDEYVGKAITIGKRRVVVVDETDDVSIDQGRRSVKKRSITRVISPGMYLPIESVTDSNDHHSLDEQISVKNYDDGCHRYIVSVSHDCYEDCQLKSMFDDHQCSDLMGLIKERGLRKNVYRSNLRSNASMYPPNSSMDVEIGIVITDISTGEVHIDQCSVSELIDVISGFTGVREVLFSAQMSDEYSFLRGKLEEKGIVVSTLPDFSDLEDCDIVGNELKSPDYSTMRSLIPKVESKLQLKSLIDLWKYISFADYGSQNMHASQQKVNTCLDLSYETRRSLEINESLYESSKVGSLLHCLDNCASPMGSRLLLSRLNRPISDQNSSEIIRRQNMVHFFKSSAANIDCAKMICTRVLKNLGDFPKHSRMACTQRINSRGLMPLSSLYLLADSIQTANKLGLILQDWSDDDGTLMKQSVIDSVTIPNGLLQWSNRILRIRSILRGGESSMLLNEEQSSSVELELEREFAIRKEMAIDGRKANQVRNQLEKKLWKHHRPRLDHWNQSKLLTLDASSHTHGYSLLINADKLSYLINDDPKESLDIRTFAKTHGFILQSSSAKRYRLTHQDLKSIQDKYDQSQATIQSLTQRIRAEMSEELKNRFSETLFNLSRSLAELDLSASHAQLSVDRGYTTPEMILDSDSSEDGKGRSVIYEVIDGRHPVVERHVSDFTVNSLCISNDCGRDEPRFTVLTGPNLGGKSVFLRQVAVLAVMAQAGLDVPAQRVRLTPLDGIHTHLCGADRITQNSSSFMTEMTQVSRVLHKCTDRSLVILDETCRGTSPSEGLQIAMAISEHLFRQVRCLTLFSTHFFEIAEWADRISKEDCDNGVQNRQMRAQVLKDGELWYEHKVVDGYATHSHALSVAKLAGIPSSVLESVKNTQ